MATCNLFESGSGFYKTSTTGSGVIILLGRGEDGGVVEHDAHDEHSDAPPDTAEHTLRAVLVLNKRIRLTLTFRSISTTK